MPDKLGFPEEQHGKEEKCDAASSDTKRNTLEKAYQDKLLACIATPRVDWERVFNPRRLPRPSSRPVSSCARAKDTLCLANLSTAFGCKPGFQTSLGTAPRRCWRCLRPIRSAMPLERRSTMAHVKDILTCCHKPTSR